VNQAQVTCTAYGSTGNVLGSGLKAGSLAPLQHTAFLIDAQFGSLFTGQRGTLSCGSTARVAAVELRALSSPAAVSSMPVISSASASSLSLAQTFPHIAADNGWHTDIFVLNTGAAPATFSLVFHTDTGAPMALVGNPQTTSVTLAPNAVAFFRTAPVTTANDGWAELVSNVPLSGVVVYGLLRSDGSYSEASALLSSPYSSFTVPIDETVATVGSPFVNGIALANTDANNPAQISCTAYGTNGDVLGSGLQVGPLKPLQHTAFLLDAQFGSLFKGLQGSLACQSSTRLAAVELRALSSPAAVSSMPVIPNTGAN
jgi:hypothetical protein